MVTFVHTGDVHLDTPFSANFSRQQMQIRRREIMQSFQKIVLSAQDKDFLFIAGDLFDGQLVSSDTVSFVKRCFDSIPETQIFISAGNHDPNTDDSVYARTAWGDNVHVFQTEWEYFDFPEKKTRIHGISFSETHQESSLMDEREVVADWCNLMVLHGDIVSVDGESLYNPIDKNQIASSKMDYVALGHIHQKTELLRADGTYYAYCGVPEGRGFDEDGEKGFYVGEAEKGHVILSWQSVAFRRAYHLSVDVTNATDSIDIQERIIAAIGRSGTKEDMYKVSLTGKIRTGMVDAGLLSKVLADYVFHIDVIDNTKLDVSLEDIAKEQSLRGAFALAMMERINTLSADEKEIGEIALEIGLAVMDGGREG